MFDLSYWQPDCWLIIHATDAETAWIHTWLSSLGTTSCKYCYTAYQLALIQHGTDKETLENQLREVTEGRQRFIWNH